MLVWKSSKLSSYGSFRAMPDPSGGGLERDVHRGYECFDK
jgi:hypothetical protein